MDPVLRPSPDLRTRVWGGTRLGSARGGEPIGESWLAGPASRVPGANGGDRDSVGPTLDELAARHGRDLVGSRSPWPDRFPLLAKLLDPAAWLSVQVHPDDGTARRLAGPEAVGKTEAWYVIDAAPDASLLVGVRPGTPEARVRDAIEGGGLVELLEPLRPRAGDAILVGAGTLHAVGPGVFLYELQQPSDLTYRADDWGRPATKERPLHVAETLASYRHGARPEVRHVAPDGAGLATLVACQFFDMRLAIVRDAEPVALDPGGLSPHVVTALRGRSLVLRGTRWSAGLDPFETVVVAASAGPYRIESAGDAAPEAAASAGAASAIVASLPDDTTPEGTA